MTSNNALTLEELEYIKLLCEAAPRTGIDWALGVSLFQPRDERERRWKERMLKGIELASPQAAKHTKPT